MASTQHIVIVGATSAIAEHCARLWIADRPQRMTLIGRDTERMLAIADDLKVRSPGTAVRVRAADFLDADSIADAVAASAAEAAIDLALIAHGVLPVQADCQASLSHCADTLVVNGISPVLFAEAFAGQMERAGRGTLVIIGSVAGDRGRKSNYAYGAAKGLVERYAEGLQHRFTGSEIKVVLVKPGPTDTPMTAHLRDQGLALAPVAGVAADIVRAAARGQRVLYTPFKWRLIMTVIKLLPARIFNRLNI